MRKLYKKLEGWFSKLETKEARRSVAGDLKKASAAMFGLLLVSMPGAYASVFKALAAMLEVKATGIGVSTWTLVALAAGSFVLRILAFLLECDFKAAEKQSKGSRPSSKHHR